MDSQVQSCNKILTYMRECVTSYKQQRYCKNIQELYHNFCVEMDEKMFDQYQMKQSKTTYVIDNVNQ